MIRDPAISMAYGYSLHQEGGKPFVIREWCTKIKDGNGVKVTQRHESGKMSLTRESFAPGVHGDDAFAELKATWREYVAWNTANGRGM